MMHRLYKTSIVLTLTAALSSTAFAQQGKMRLGALPPLPGLSTPRSSRAKAVYPRSNSYFQNKLAQLIEGWMGVPYLWGGCAKSGTDCSGFVMGVYRELGIRLPHGSAYLKSCEVGPVVTGKWEYGDVLIWKGHAAIYTGNGTTAETVKGHVGRSFIGCHPAPVVVRRFLNAIYDIREEQIIESKPEGFPANDFDRLVNRIQCGDINAVIAHLDTDPQIVRLRGKAGATLLHWAAQAGNYGMCAVLIDHGADVNARKTDGVTPLHVAAALGKEDAVKLLLERGADADAVDMFSRTPLAVARGRGQETTAAVLAASDRVVQVVDPSGAEPIATTLPTMESTLSSVVSPMVQVSAEARLAAALPVEPEIREHETTLTVENASGPASAGVQVAQVIKPNTQTNEVQILPTIVVTANKSAQSAPEDAEARQMFYLLNAERRKQGLSAVTYDPEASLVAQTVAAILERSLSGGGSSTVEKVEDLLLGAGVSYSVCAQTSVACDSVVTAHSSLLQMESHKTNILSERFTRIGVAVLKGGPWGRICVELLLG